MDVGDTQKTQIFYNIHNMEKKKNAWNFWVLGFFLIN